MYSVTYSDEALKAVARFKKSDQQSYRKLLKLVEELHIHPRTGTGKPEALRGEGGNVFSRAINKKDRLVYEIYDEEVTVYVNSTIANGSS